MTKDIPIMPWELYESIVETLEIMTDRDLVAALWQGIDEIGQRKGIPWTSARKRLRL